MHVFNRDDVTVESSTDRYFLLQAYHADCPELIVFGNSMDEVLFNLNAELIEA